jgi:phosphoesterase RecJ-like protein
LIFIEQPPGTIKVSFRSKGSLNCNETARAFGGGGHAAAAGATVPGPLEAARTAVLKVVLSRL